MGQLDGKVAVITGGASGIGAATVRLFVAEGARVVIADVLDDAGARLAEELCDACVYVHTDVSDEEHVRRVVATATQRFGGLDCLFNNAGFGGVEGRIEETDTAGLRRTTDVLFNGVVYGMKHAAPAMRARGQGSIVNTASVAGIQAGNGPHVYSALKAAVIQLTRSVATELGESGVRVNCICPGAIVTPIFARHLGLSQTEVEERTPILNQVFGTLQPIQRPGQPEDIAQAVLWLASDASCFVNGHALVVDGGLTLGSGWSQAEAAHGQMRELLGATKAGR
jgi:NAD(P)-dependent dehydrogenase (short-subunit alcohol dehydrogenase family)